MSGQVEQRLKYLDSLSLVLGVVVIFSITLFATFAIYLMFKVNSSANEVKNITENNQATLCAFRNNIQERRDSTVKYLEDHPRGVVSPKTGAIIISAAELQRSVDAQTTTLDAIDKHLMC